MRILLAYISALLNPVSESERIGRATICNKCPEYTCMFCKQCGCFLPVKTRAPESNCPLGLW